MDWEWISGNGETKYDKSGALTLGPHGSMRIRFGPESQTGSMKRFGLSVEHSHVYDGNELFIGGCLTRDQVHSLRDYLDGYIEKWSREPNK